MTRPFHDSRHACYQVHPTIFQSACQHQRDALCWLPRCQPTSVHFDECQMSASRVGSEPAHSETQKCMIPTYAAPQRIGRLSQGNLSMASSFPASHSYSLSPPSSFAFEPGFTAWSLHRRRVPTHGTLAPGTSTPYPRLGLSSHTYPADEGPHQVLLTFLAWTADQV
jgi:hypothetical protein